MKFDNEEEIISAYFEWKNKLLTIIDYAMIGELEERKMITPKQYEKNTRDLARNLGSKTKSEWPNSVDFYLAVVKVGLKYRLPSEAFKSTARKEHDQGIGPDGEPNSDCAGGMGVAEA